MSLIQNLFHGIILVPLMRHPHLVMPRDFITRRGADPFRSAPNEMLRANTCVSEKPGSRSHGDEFCSRQGWPDLANHGAVIHIERRSNALRETRPVFGVVAFGPLEEGGLAADDV